jgi:predicted nucleotidyltransferase
MPLECSDDRIGEILSQLRSRFEALYNDRLASLVLYGSYARGEARPDSDFDVLIVLKGKLSPGKELEKTKQIRAVLSEKHGVTISCLFISEEMFNWKGPSRLLRNIRREGIGF